MERLAASTAPVALSGLMLDGIDVAQDPFADVIYQAHLVEVHFEATGAA